MWITQIKKFVLDFLFPPRCLGCQKEGNYLCEDCKSTLEISSVHQVQSTKYLKDLYFAVSYQSPLIKNLIQKFKYQPFIKELSKPLSSLIITHFQLLEQKPIFFYQPKTAASNFIIIPIPLERKRLKWRGFNQAEEIAKPLSKFLKIPLNNKVLMKIKPTPPQTELPKQERKINIKNTFLCQNQEIIRGKKIILVDDLYTTGSTMEEAARVLKKAGAKEIIGVVVARANPKECNF